MTRVLICDAPLPRAGWVEAGSRRPAHPEDSGYFFPDGRTRAKHIHSRNVRTTPGKHVGKQTRNQFAEAWLSVKS